MERPEISSASRFTSALLRIATTRRSPLWQEQHPGHRPRWGTTIRRSTRSESSHTHRRNVKPAANTTLTRRSVAGKHLRFRSTCLARTTRTSRPSCTRRSPVRVPTRHGASPVRKVATRRRPPPRCARQLQLDRQQRTSTRLVGTITILVRRVPTNTSLADSVCIPLIQLTLGLAKTKSLRIAPSRRRHSPNLASPALHSQMVDPAQSRVCRSALMSTATERGMATLLVNRGHTVRTTGGSTSPALMCRVDRATPRSVPGLISSLPTRQRR